MTIQQYVADLRRRPSCAAWNVPNEEKDEALRASVASVVEKVLGEGRQFPFSKAVQELATEADVALYTVAGNLGDCGDILSVRYDTGKTLLDKVEDDALEAYESSLTSEELVDVVAWCLVGTEGDKPVIKLIGPPATSDVPIYVKYRRSTMPVDEFPRNWMHVITYGVEADLFGAVGSVAHKTDFGMQVNGHIDYESRFRSALLKMIDYYRRGKADESPMAHDSTWRAANRRRNAKYGYRN